MEDIVSGSSSASGTPVILSNPLPEAEDNPGTPSSINTESTEHSKAKKPHVNQSVVWEHFKKLELVEKEPSQVVCKYCNRHIGYHPKRQGTSPMMTHLTSKSIPSRLPIRESIPYVIQKITKNVPQQIPYMAP